MPEPMVLLKLLLACLLFLCVQLCLWALLRRLALAVQPRPGKGDAAAPPRAGSARADDQPRG